MSGGEAAEGEVDGRTLFLYDGETADLEFDIGVLKVDPTAEGDAEGYVEVILIFELEERALVAVHCERTGQLSSGSNGSKYGSVSCCLRWWRGWTSIWRGSGPCPSPPSAASLDMCPMPRP